MTTARWQQIEGVFQAVLESPEERRPGLLDETCGGDAELRKEVESLLACYGKGEAFLSTAIQKEANQLAQNSIESFVGRRIGPYKLTRLLGRGGMGVVYLATRDAEDFQQEVAIKLMRRGLDTEDIASRFRAERRILSRLDHPNIARLLDGGATDEGVPYFVMEYVDGAPLLEYCRQRSLGVEERLGLFRSVCAAVHYAHQRLVVHRDLKPQNILVTEAGGVPIVKLLDFGIAKLLSDDSAHTHTGARLLTPDYASPEQVLGKPVTTASDVYALGVVLYELLTGTRPHQLHDPTPAAISVAICETEPSPPSRHNRSLNRDLDNIVLMALRKEPDRRYASAEQFSEDIRRYLAGLPVIARPDTILYRTAKFVRRNRIATAAVLFAWIALASGLGVAIWQAKRAARGRDEARKYISRVLMNSFQKLRMLPGTLSAQSDLAAASLVYLNKLSLESGNDPATRFDLATGYFWVAQIQGTIGRMSLGRFDAALETDGKALAIAEKLYREDPSNTVYITLLGSILDHIGLDHLMLGHDQEAVAWAERAEPLISRSSAKAYDQIGTPDLNSYLGEVAKANRLASKGHVRDALQQMRKVREKTPKSLVVRVAEGRLLMQTGDLEAARILFEQELARPAGRNYLQRTVRASLQAGLALLEGHPMKMNLGHPRRAVDLLGEALAEDSAVLASDSLNELLAGTLAQHRTWLAGILWETDPAKAIALYHDALEFYKKVLPRSPADLARRRDAIRLHAEMAELQRRRGHDADALDHLKAALALEKEISEPQAYTLLVQGHVQLARGERDRALASYQEAVNLAAKAVQQGPEQMELRRELADCLELLAEFHQSAGRRSEARDWYVQSLLVWREWKTYGGSSAYNERREKQAEAALARIANN